MPSLKPNHASGRAPVGEDAVTGRLALRRRDALKLFASGMALTLAGCARPRDEIIPYVDMPERMVPGEPEYYATALPLGGFARGALVKAIDGRPIKVEGNPRHPASLGSSDIFAQSAILSLYGPDRSGTVRGSQPIETWDSFLTALRPRLAHIDRTHGQGLRLVTGRITSPTLRRQISEFLKSHERAAWHAYEPAEGDLARSPGIRRRPRLAQATLIVCLDADPLGPGPDQIVNGREFAAGRLAGGKGKVSRLYSVESSRTLTGANADHRLSIDPKAIDALARALADHVLQRKSGRGNQLPEPVRKLFQAITADLTSTDKAVILAGDTLPQPTRADIERANDRLGASYARYSGPADHEVRPMQELWSALEKNEVSDLVLLDRNPVYDFPDPKLKAAISKVAFSVHAGMLENETARVTGWHLPLSHILETWSDLTATDGTVSIVQPLIRPLYDTRSLHEIVAMLSGDPAPSGYEIVRRTWQKDQQSGPFEAWWRKSLIAGLVSGQTGADAAVAAGPASAESSGGPADAGSEGGFTAVIRPDPTIYDGTFADNAWLQECPKPIIKNTWSNVIALSHADAEKLGVTSGDVIAVTSHEGRIEGPVQVDKGQGDGIVGLTLGYGRGAAGAIGTGLGYNARQLSPREFASVISSVKLVKTDKRDPVPSTQKQFELEGELSRLMPLVTPADHYAVDLKSRPDFGEHFNHPQRPSDGYSWAMVIDNAACIGCHACVVACQAENNIAVVGPEEVANHRIMQWIRVDRYERDSESPTSVGGFEPVPCMQCEKAPCEPVCPVEASVHDVEGINNQVYNRCVGTRFCQSNCPYKVRRFNWFAYNSGQEYKNLGEDPMPAEKNPDVTVRARGVMEKCTYCVQRISRARRQAEKEDRRIPDGGVVTACQQACPTQAIHFGNLQDLGSQVSTLRNDPRHFTLLEELGTSPRTTYLARLRNANPDLQEESS